MNTAGGCTCAPNTMCWPQHNPTVPGPDCHYHTGEVMAMKTADLETKGANTTSLGNQVSHLHGHYLINMAVAAIHHPEWDLEQRGSAVVQATAEISACSHQWEVTCHVKHHLDAMKLRMKIRVNLIVANCTVALPNPIGKGHLVVINENVLSCQDKYLPHGLSRSPWTQTTSTTSNTCQ